MGIAQYNRGTRALQDEITRKIGGHVPGDYADRNPVPRPAEWGSKRLAEATESARRYLRYVRRFDKPYPDVEFLTESVWSGLPKFTCETCHAAAVAALAEDAEPAKRNAPPPRGPRQLSLLAVDPSDRIAEVMRRARLLSAVTPLRSTYRRTDGVVPLTRDDALAWVKANSLEQIADKRLVFKVGVTDTKGTIGAACFGAWSAELGPDAIEVTPVAPRANEAAFQAALRTGALAAVAMGVERVVYYRPVSDDPGDPFGGFDPLPSRSFRASKGGGLPWRLEGTGYFEPWLREHAPERYTALKADEIRAAQVEAILAWEEAEQELLDRTDYAPTDEQYVALAHAFGFNYFDDWRPSEMTREDARQFMSMDTLFERHGLVVTPRARTMFTRPLPFSVVNEVVPAWHSHLKRKMRGHLFSLGVYAPAVPGFYPEHLRAVAVASTPRSRALMQQGAIEVVRVAVGPNLPPLVGVDPARHKAAESSFVLSRIVEVSIALGYDRVVSSVMLGEKGAGYRGANWRPVAVTMGGEWSSAEREREDAEQPGVKIRWEGGPAASASVALPGAGTVDALLRDAAELAAMGAMPLGGPRMRKTNR